MSELLSTTWIEFRNPDWDGHEECVSRRLLAHNDAPWVVFFFQVGALKVGVSWQKLADEGLDLETLEQSLVARMVATTPSIQKMDLSLELGDPRIPMVFVQEELAATRVLDPACVDAIHRELGAAVALGLPAGHQLVAVPLKTAFESDALTMNRHLYERAEAEDRLTPGMFLLQQGKLMGRIATADARSNKPDFIKLSQAAHPASGTGTMEDKDALWTALFGLPEWYFPVFPEGPIYPFLSTINGKRWAFAFTEPSLLDFFLEEQSLQAADGRSFLTMPVDGARQWIAENGDEGKIFGVHFNFGCPGWFAPYKNVEAIYQHLF